ncbi:MAG: NAD(P)/FAD-dependent oxidoreductase, partial [Acidobacteriota bacterium]
AGLAAARTLADAGHDVVILEAKNRIGGRIHTSSRWADAPMDLGASWIHGTEGNPIAALARRIGAETVETRETGSIHRADGAELTTLESLRLLRIQGQIHKIITKGQGAAADRPLRTTVETGVGFGELSPRDRRFVNLVITETEQGLAGSARSLSTRWLGDPGTFSGPEVVFPAGYGVITDHLAGGLAIELAQTVEQISVVSGGVTVSTRRGVFTGDRAIVTLPLGVLKSGAVGFSPGLPASMRGAIDTLEMGVLNKVYLRFPKVFWPRDPQWIQQVPANHGEWVSWLNFDRLVDQPILMAFNAGDFGREIEGWPDREIVAGGMERLRSIFGHAVPDPVGFQITRWASDPHTLGSYSYIPAGGDPAMRDALGGNIEGRVFFAGEATNRDYYPTVHGAYLSGVAAAADVAASGRFPSDSEGGDTSR